MRILGSGIMPVSTALATMMITSFSLLSIYGFQTACACQCAALPPEMNYQRSDIVFLGKITGMQKAPFSDVGKYVTFDVLKSWKGVDTKKVTIHTGDGSSCGSYPFRMDDPERQYLVYGTKDFSEMRVTLCGGTIEREKGDIDYDLNLNLDVERSLKFLDDNFMSIELRPGHTLSMNMLPFLQVLGSLLAFAVVAFMVIRRNGKH